jgi:glycosyltransferase involved in cell wall biosynthesis
VIAHLANNPHHAFCYRVAVAHPCVAVLHDVVLHPLLAGFADSEERIPMFEAPLEEEYGDAGRKLADLKRLRVADGLEHYLFPLVGRVARGSRALIVHGGDALRRVAPLAPGVPARVVPHLALKAPPGLEDVDRAGARSRLGLPAEAFVVAHVGFLTPAKQPAAVIEGYARLRREVPEALLVLVGQDQAAGRDLLEALGVGDASRSLGFASLTDLHLALRAADAVVSLRYPTTGEASGTAVRALAEGRALVTSNLGWFSDLPDDAVRRVAVDGDQAEDVAAHLTRLAGDPGEREAMEAAAGAYARTVLDPDRCARGYLEAAATTARPGSGRPA